MKYIKEDIETMLREHKKNEAKKIEIQLKKEEYEERLKYSGMVHQEEEKEVIESMQLNSPVISDIPKSQTNKISDTTSNTVIRYKKEINYINKEDRQELERKIRECEQIEAELDKKIVRVQNMLEQLSKEQKFVITSYYLEKSKWDYVANEYYEEYNKPKSINQLLNIRDEAMKSMLDIVNIAI